MDKKKDETIKSTKLIGEVKKKINSKPLSLYPLTVDEALKIFMQVAEKTEREEVKRFMICQVDSSVKIY